MNHSSIRILSASILFLSGVACLQPLAAGTFGDFTYVDNGTGITISMLPVYASGAITIPPTIDGKPVTAIGDSAFYACRRIQSVSIPPSVTTIGPRAFAVCTDLTNLTIPEGVSVIEEETFYQCYSLTNFNLPATVTTIRPFAFSGCLSLKTIRIPESVSAIADSTFSLCTGLVDVTFPRNLTVIGAEAFFACQSLSAIKIPPKVTTLGASAFAASGLTRIVIPENVKAIGPKAFSRCLKLRSVEIIAGLSSIEKATFADCNNLTRITLPGSMRKIGELAFQGCGFSNIDLKNVNAIEARAFSHCAQLPSVTLPQSIKSIGDKAFSDCKQLASAVFEGDAPKMGKHVFGASGPDFRIFVSDESDRFTVPRWHGYGVSLPREEITVQLANEDHILNTDHTSNFGMVLDGTGSRPIVFTIRNVGTRELSGLSTRISGGDWSDFLIKVPMKRSLAPGKTTTVAIVFKPREKGKRASTLQILSSDENESPFEIGLSGVGLQVLK
jgi:hypothetical protein